MRIHPLSLIAPSATLGDGVQIGPFCVVEDDVTIGRECILEGHVVVKSGTALGEKNHLFEGAVVGGIPQHTNVPERLGRVIIGSGNTIRENVTIHKAMQPGHDTVIGDHCLLMCNAHVAHDCRLGNHVVLTNNVMLAGHVTVGSRAFLSGGAGVHQFCRVGALAMVGGLAHISRDVPPFVTIDGQSSYVVGLNQVGLKRAGLRHKGDCTVEGGLSRDLPQRADVEGDPGSASAAIPRRGGCRVLSLPGIDQAGHRSRAADAAGGDHPHPSRRGAARGKPPGQGRLIGKQSATKEHKDDKAGDYSKMPAPKLSSARVSRRWGPCCGADGGR